MRNSGRPSVETANPATVSGWFRCVTDGGQLRPTIVFCEARIDNQDELARRFDLSADLPTEDLILAAYEHEGAHCAKFLLGDFAFAIWDPEKRHVFAARDAMGCQPVYYFCRQHRFVISDRLDLLLSTKGVSDEPDEAFVAASLINAFAHQERTHFAHIRKIPPGHCLVANEDTVSVRPFWRPEDVAERKWTSHSDCLEEFRGLLRQAVRDRLPQRGRVGVHVSGGLDCSSLAVLASNELHSAGRQSPLALSWYPPPQEDNTEFERSEYARIADVCCAANVEPVYTVQTPGNILEVLNRDHRTRPICNASYNERLVQIEAARRGVTTVLSGFGGDEAASFNGRGYYQRLALTGRWRKLSRFAAADGRHPLRFCASQCFVGLQNLLMSDAMLKEYEDSVQGMDVPLWKGLLRAGLLPLGLNKSIRAAGNQRTLESETASFLSADIRKRIKTLPPISRVRLTNDRVARCTMLRWEPITARIESWAADGALHGIRYTYPLMDRRIVEFALSLPGHVFRSEKYNRLFFRQAMEPVLPASVCWETSKNDPARQKPLVRCLKESLVSIGKTLRTHGTTSPRAAHLDLDRLIRDLDEQSLQKRTKLGRLISAVEYLGTESLHEHRFAA